MNDLCRCGTRSASWCPQCAVPVDMAEQIVFENGIPASVEDAERILAAAQAKVVQSIADAALCRECKGPLGVSRIRYCETCYDRFMAAHPELEDA